jgi:hypothetical protein
VPDRGEKRGPGAQQTNNELKNEKKTGRAALRAAGFSRIVVQPGEE